MKLLAVLAFLATFILTGALGGTPAEAGPYRPGMPTGDPHRFNSLQFLGAVAAPTTCSVQNNGVSPSICLDFVHRSFTPALSVDTCAQSSGAVCTGTEIEQVNSLSLPTGPVMVVLDATYPATGGNQISMDNQSTGVSGSTFSAGINPSVTNQIATFCGTNAPGKTQGTSRTGAVEMAIYWDGTTCQVSFAGDAVTPTGSGTVPTGTATYGFGNDSNSPGSGTALGLAVRSFRVYSGTFTNAQVQLAATQ